MAILYLVSLFKKNNTKFRAINTKRQYIEF